MENNRLILDVLEGKDVERTPVWLMRQAGRYMSEYRKIREKVSFLELCKTPELACEVTLQPLKAFKLDAAILFSDILVPIEPMGVDLEFTPAPVIANPVRNPQDVQRLKPVDPEEELPFVLEAVRLIKDNIEVPLIGFAGAPFTLACYMVEGSGSKNFLEIKTLMHKNPDAFFELMEKVTESTYRYLQAQINNGCSIVQVFDTWAGILSPSDYKTFVYPFVEKLVNKLENAHIIYFAKDSTTFYKDIKKLNCAGLGVDWKIALNDAADLLDNKFVLQGNLDPAVLFADQKTIADEIDRIISEAKDIKGHIFNLGHGILPKTPVENVKFMVDYVKEKTADA
ncbi:Uroporphyrinogen decarboxylase [Flexistipes sinusarabici DSM 4947]|uniref:Uroporphyrinogen decarboxylase n=1 Tax=Flexistipes sinusarabici (strain ATCC 49648 / DSM 4947 / MAS 10) TaxID=717231 RepID=F8E6H8_FLESM|nr:uroporphyrinogen decarboxylase [Flexistipes sinusarabici]AEI14815.1 Uroporphyrinogen decarboxylase [Flexistipes sinusarabici DSM 4947]